MKPISEFAWLQMPALPITFSAEPLGGWSASTGDSDEGGERSTMTKSRVPLVDESIMSWRYFEVCCVLV